MREAEKRKEYKGREGRTRYIKLVSRSKGMDRIGEGSRNGEGKGREK